MDMQKVLIVSRTELVSLYIYMNTSFLFHPFYHNTLQYSRENRVLFQKNIGEMIKKGYSKDKILMVGDAPGDRDAAAQNGVWYYPILVGKEGESWNKLLEEAFPKLLEGTFDETYQKMLIEAFERNLGV